MRRAALSGIVCLLAAALAGCGNAGSSASTAQPGSAAAPNGEERIEEFGREAAGAERQTLLAGFHGYLRAVASRRYGAACSHLAATVRRSLDEFASPQGQPAECAAILPGLLAPTAAALARAQARGEVRKARVEQGRAFVVFRVPGAGLYMLPMKREGSGWKAALLAASTLGPAGAG